MIARAKDDCLLERVIVASREDTPEQMRAHGAYAIHHDELLFKRRAFVELRDGIRGELLPGVEVSQLLINQVSAQHASNSFRR